MRSLAAALAGFGGWRRFLSAFLLGVLAAAAMPPFQLWPLLFISFTGMIWLLDGVATRRAAFGLGWAFGFGFFVAGLHWLAYPLLVDSAQFAWLIPVAVLGLPAGLAIFPGLAILAVYLVGGSGVRRVLFLGLAWMAAEALRGTIFTGFPWNLIGIGWSGSTAMLQVTSVIGIYGLSLLTVIAAAMPSILWSNPNSSDLIRLEPDYLANRRHRFVVGVTIAVMLIVWGLGAFRLSESPTEWRDVSLRVVQPAIAQRDKWRADRRVANFEMHIELSAGANVAPGTTGAIIWPETAATLPLVEGGPVAARIGATLDSNSVLLTGAFRREGDGQNLDVRNSLQVVDSTARFLTYYDPHPLVPFGEYMPFRSLMNSMGLRRITEGSADIGAGSDTRTLHVEGLPPFSPLICYEAIFSGRVVDRDDRSEWLLNITNDAWFGPFAGPAQHFELARIRTIEEGLPMVRAANTGKSAIIDPHGRVIQVLGMNQAGFLDSILPAPAQGQTIFSRFGNWSPFTLWVLIAVLGLRLRSPRRARNL